MPFKAQIFESGEYKSLDLWVVFMSFFMLGGIIIGTALIYWVSSNAGGTYLGVSIAVGLIMMTANNWRYAPLKGTLKGFIEIDGEKISLPNKVINFAQIESFELSVFDYYGGVDPDSKPYHKGTPRPCLSQGVRNYIKVKTNTGEEATMYFKQEKQDDRLLLIPFMAQMIALDKIHYLKGISMLGLKYVEVKQLKEELAKYNYTISV